MVRNFAFTAKDRERAREALDIPQDCFVVLVSPGGWTDESRLPISNSVLDAFERRPEKKKLLIWVSGKDKELIEKKTAGNRQVRALSFFSPLEKLMVSSDILITKGTRITTMEAAKLGLPSISLSAGDNPVDDFLLPRIRSNIALNAKAVDGCTLNSYIDQAITERHVSDTTQTYADERDVANAIIKEAYRLARKQN